MKHDLKTWCAPFEAVWSERKRYEIRRDDRNFKVGDVLMLREWDRDTESYTGRVVTALVTYKTEGGAWGIPDEHCVMSLDLLTREYTRQAKEQ